MTSQRKQCNHFLNGYVIKPGQLVRAFLLTVPDLVHKRKQLCILKALDLGYGHYEHTMQPDP